MALGEDVVVPEASAGIGRDIRRVFAVEGAHVIFAARTVVSGVMRLALGLPPKRGGFLVVG